MPFLNHHKMLPQAFHDESSRRDFTSALIKHLDADMRPQIRGVYERTVKPGLTRATKKEPDRHQIAKAMVRQPANQMWSALRTDAQDQMYATAGPIIMRQLDDLIERAAQTRGPGSLRLNPSLRIPPYHTAVDIHRKPGGYHTEYAENDVLAGAEFDQTITMYAMGTQGPNNDDPGNSIALWIRRTYPDMKVRRILDMGCTIGHSTVPFKQVFPDAEVHGIDVAAPCLRYGHARAKAMGVAIEFSQQNAEKTSFPDGHFDIVTSRIMLHEMSRKAVPLMLAESHRLLRPGGLMVHSDIPMFDEMDAYQASLRYWDTMANQEPFMATVYELPLEKMAVAGGFSKSAVFRAWADSELRKQTNFDPKSNRAGGRFFLIGAVR